MKDQIKQVQEYFKNKIIEGDFEIKEIEEHTISLVIDGEYYFKMWIANGKDHYRQYYNSFEVRENFIYLPKFNQKDMHKAFSKVRKPIKSYLDGKLLQEKKQAIKKLQEELKSLEN